MSGEPRVPKQFENMMAIDSAFALGRLGNPVAKTSGAKGRRETRPESGNELLCY